MSNKEKVIKFYEQVEKFVHDFTLMVISEKMPYCDISRIYISVYKNVKVSVMILRPEWDQDDLQKIFEMVKQYGLKAKVKLNNNDVAIEVYAGEEE